MKLAGLYIQPVDWALLSARPRTGGLSAAYHRACRDAAVAFRAKYPRAPIMLGRGFGSTLEDDAHRFTIGFKPGGGPELSAVYGPRHADTELDPIEGKTVSKFVYDLWHGLSPELYIGPPPWGMEVTSATEAKAFLGPWWKEGMVLAVDMLAAAAAASTLAAYCSSPGVRIPLIGEPHLPVGNQWARSALIAGACSLADRVMLMLSGDTQFAFHPGLNYCIVQGGTPPADRVTIARACTARGVRVRVDTSGMTDAQVDAVFGQDMGADPGVTT